MEDTFGLQYRMLQNNQFSILAVYSISEIEPNHTEPSVGGFVVIIGKKDGSIRRSNLSLHNNDDAVAFGSCTH